MKKILSILLLALIGISTTQASQTFTFTSDANSRTIYFRINKTSGSVTRSKTTATGSAATVSLTVNNTNYQTFAVTTGTTTTYRTITITLPDDVNYLEVYNNKTYVSALNLSGLAANLTSLSLNGCTALTSLTLGTMTALTDLDLSNTNATIVGTVTGTNCPNLYSYNVANNNLQAFSYHGTNLQSLDLSNNKFAGALNLSAFTNLDILRCEGNDFTALTVPASTTTVSASANALISVSGYGEALQVIDVANNELQTVTLTNLAGLTDADVSGNHLTFRSLPSEENKPARIIYEGNDGQYVVTDQMRAAFGSYTYPLQSPIPSYASRSDASYTIDLAEELLDANSQKNVVAQPKAVAANGTTLTDLAKATSDVDGGVWTQDSENDLYGFLSAQERVRIQFTDTQYPLLTLYSDDFTVPSGITGTIVIVDEDGTTLYTKTNAFFSDAMDGLPADARRDYTKYTYPAVPTTAGQTWTVTAAASDDAPFAWAKTYGSATWYYLKMRDAKYVTAGEQLYSLGGASIYNGYKLKDSYDPSDDNYQWAFVGNQYEGFKIVNKNRGSEMSLQSWAGYANPHPGGDFPVLREGESMKFIVTTNSAGTGFSLKFNGLGVDDNGADAPSFLNDFQSKGAVNFWSTNDYDAQNNIGSLFNVVFAADPIGGSVVKWIFVDGSDNAVYTMTEDATSGTTISEYPAAVTELVANRFVTLPTLTPFTVQAGINEKRVAYIWNGPFQISTEGDEHHYNIRLRGTMYLTSNTNSAGALSFSTTRTSDNNQRWMFFGDPFNGFIIKNYAMGDKALVAANGSNTNGTSFPTFGDEGTLWPITTCTQSGYTSPFSIAVPGTSSFWNQYGGTSNDQGLRYWTRDGSADTGAAIEVVSIDEAISSVTITWNIVDESGNSVYSVMKDYNINSSVSAYPEEITALTDRFVSFPTLTAFTADRSKSVQVTYSWVGPFEFTTDTAAPHCYYIKSARYLMYVHAPYQGAVGESPTHSQSMGKISPRDVWFFTGDPFQGFEMHTLANPDAGISSTWPISATPAKFIPRSAPDITTDYWDNALPSAAFGFVVPGIAETTRGSCLSESGATWTASSIVSDKGCCFVVEEADLDYILPDGYYHVRCMGSGLQTKYWKADGGMLYSNGDIANMNTVFRVFEQSDGTYQVAGIQDNTLMYLDNTRSSYSQQFTLSSDPSIAVKAQIVANGKSGETPFYAIKLSEQTNYSGYSYANTNTGTNNVVTWSYTSGTADGSAWTFEPYTTTLRSTDNVTYYGTAYMPFDYTLPEGIEAHTITTDGTMATTSQLSGCVPAGTGVLFKANGISTVPFLYMNYSLTSDDETQVANNVLTGTYTDRVASEGEAYTFQAKNGQVGFYRYTAGKTLNAYKAYIPGSVAANGLRAFVIDFDGGAATPIELIFDDEPESHANIVYDLQGRRVAQPQKGGIYIINGKKVYMR